MDTQKLRDHAHKELVRAQERARVRAEVAYRDPFNGAAVHAAVEAKAYADGFEAAMSTIFGVMEAQEA